MADSERFGRPSTTTVLGPARAANDAPVDRQLLRGVLGQFATGITVVTAGRDMPCGMTANSFTSVSLDPPLVLVCIKRDAAMHEAILLDGSFAISVLAGDQEREARYFADRSRPRGPEEFDSIDWGPGPHTGAPVISGSLAWIECRLRDVHKGGDHSIFLGEVLATARSSQDSALLFFGGGFRRLETATP